ncbi:major facilitator superfamily domain-containing protein 12 [Lepeophtheirus salmonis]|uniref:major facilitator superfamily domain-containing protein 12 n=1 Tax=Lepeophtheirus salmonis TaxID=72036 RepID=UPI001AE2EEDD|nr:major facilitator superfamily domain-containing protein 12-like [Lepeophtheirus salmonis]
MSTSATGSHLGWFLKFSYSLGHVQNDLYASMWFTYLLVFFNKVLLFDNTSAGVVLFIGQLADGISTPLVGIFCDRGSNSSFLCARIGSRRAWHLIGTICVTLSFPFIWLPIPESFDTHLWAQILYYACFVVVFQFGWAAVQISHLAMIPELSPSIHERTGLTAIRYGATVISNITVSVITWIFLGISTDGTALNPSHEDAFNDILIVVVSIGIVASLLFHILVRRFSEDPPILNDDSAFVTEQNDQEIVKEVPFVPMGIRDWVKEPTFYLVGVMYMFTRLFVNLTQAYIPFYLSETLILPAVNIAIIPLVMFVSGFFVSFIMKCTNNRIGRKPTFIIGSIIGLVGCVMAYFDGGGTNFFINYGIYAVAILIGAGASVLLITSLSLTSELIGANIESAAFVFGAMSLTDKLSNGLAVVMIQTYVPDPLNLISSKDFYRTVLTFVGGGSALSAGIALLLLAPFTLSRRRKQPVEDSQHISDHDVINC